MKQCRPIVVTKSIACLGSMLLLPFFLFAQLQLEVALPELDSNRILFEKARTLRTQAPREAIALYNTCFRQLMEERDTLNSISVLLDQAQTYGHQARYKDSYDKLWKALLLADEAGLEQAKAYIYLYLGRYYSFYKRRRKAVEYFDLSLQTQKKLVEENRIDPAYLADSYYAFCSTHRELREPQLGRLYLDSCLQFHDPGISRIDSSYLQFEKAFLLKEDGTYDEAIQTLRSVIPWMQEHNPGYQTLVYAYLGDAYHARGDFAQSEQCFKTALDISSTYQSHIDFTPTVHQRLSDLYFDQADLDAAYAQLKRVKELDERFFDSRSQNNRPLLEIQDAFRLEKELQDRREKEQKLTELENEERVLFLQRTILIVSIIFLSLIGIIYFNHVRSKHKTEKQLIQKKQELEIQKANEIVALKNRELSASTLKLIQKDEFINTLKDKLSQNEDSMSIREVKRALNTISVGNEHNWKEFEARFIDVNKDFYTRLKDKYPDLTQGDLKLCALIKLNFSSKDMAKLMGISVESVHTTRYRLRKKLGLTRKVNLTEFIANV